MQDNNDSNIISVLGIFEINPYISIREIIRQLNILRSTVIRILKKIHFHPYRISLTPALSNNNMCNKVQFCRWTLEILRINSTFFQNVLFSDESTFYNIGQLKIDTIYITGLSTIILVSLSHFVINIVEVLWFGVVL